MSEVAERFFSSQTGHSYPRFSSIKCYRGVGYVLKDCNRIYCFECYTILNDLFSLVGERGQPIKRMLWHAFADGTVEIKKCYLCSKNLLNSTLIESCPDCVFAYIRVFNHILETGINPISIVKLRYNLIWELVTIHTTNRIE